MAYFTQDFLDFFNELSKNNHREWFQANKRRYEKSVKEPFVAFVQEMIDRVRADDPRVDIDPKDAIFRINRDIRFSADKTPYKTEMSALISQGGKKNNSVPGLFLQLRAEEIRIYSGAHMLEKDMLLKVRQYIAQHLDEFDSLLSDATFKEKFSDILGEKHKRLPAELQDAAEKQPLIVNKSFYYFAKLPSKTILKDDLPDEVMSYYFAAKPMGEFFKRAMGVSK